MLTIFSRSFLSPTPFMGSSVFWFAAKKEEKKAAAKKKAKVQAEKTPPKKVEAEIVTEALKIDTANTMYRNIIKKIKVNSRGRGKFHALSLLQIVYNSKKPEQQALIFEAYCNYLGHFTKLPNKVVDAMLLRIFRLNGSLTNALKVFENHSYLAYFPAYKVTQKFLQVVQANQQEYSTFLTILHMNPLIKINKNITLNIIQSMGKEETTHQNVSKASKLVVKRFTQKIIEDITAQVLLDAIALSVKSKAQKGDFKGTNPTYEVVGYFKELEQIENKSPQFLMNLSLIYLAFNNVKKAAEIAKQMPPNNLQTFISIVQKSVPKIQFVTKSSLSDLQCSDELKKRINELQDKETSQAQSTSQASENTKTQTAT